MSIWKIAWRSIQHRALASGLTAFSMALGVSLVVTVLVIHSVIDQSFKRGAQGYHYIVGPNGSPLELVFNTVFYLGTPTNTIPYEYYRELRFGRYSNDIEIAIPIALGEHFKGHQVVATTPDFFVHLETSDQRNYEFQPGGANMAAGDPFSAVIGYKAARSTGLKVGDVFRSSHGAGEEHETDFKIYGILKPTNTPNDQALFINLEGFYKMHEHVGVDIFSKSLHVNSPATGGATDSHDEEAKDENQDDATHAPDCECEFHTSGEEHEKRLTAVLIITKQKAAEVKVGTDPLYGNESTISGGNKSVSVIDAGTMSLQDRINREFLEAQAVNPTVEIALLFENIIGNVQTVLIILAVLVIIVAGIGMMVSIYNSMNERRQEIAIMRALGASRFTVMGIILSESILLSLGGGVLGVLIGHGLIGILGPQISEYTGIMVYAWQFQLKELILIPGLVALASIVGYLPAVIAYRTDVAQSLTT